jgi:hypothetical protein
LNNRTHRKVLIIDGTSSFTGGVGIADQWSGHAQDAEHWRDMHFKVTGPVAQHLRTVIVAPMTSQGFVAPFRVPATHAGTKGLVVLDQVRTVDKIRLVKRLGAVNAKTLSTVLATLQKVFAE